MKSVQELMNLEGRTALITGGAGHLGRTFAETVLELGGNVAILDIDQERCSRTASELRNEFDGEVCFSVADLESEAEIVAAVEDVLSRVGRLDILVNNAAFAGDSDLTGWTGALDRQTPDTWRRAMEVNLTSVFVLVRLLADELGRNGTGTIINISSIYGALGPDMRLYEDTKMGNPAAYAASKGGLIQLTRWLATVLAPGVRVNSISPGGISRGQPASFVSRYEQRTPLGRLATEEDLKGAMAFLASDLSAYVTGQDILVDGGWSAW